MTMKSKILNIIVNSHLEIKSYSKLKEYIDFCLNKNVNQHIPFKTARHHILPKALSCFPEYKNLYENVWNSSYLLHQDHYNAHFLLAEAIKNPSIMYAWNAMKNKNKIKYDINIYEESIEYANLKEEFLKLHSKERKGKKRSTASIQKQKDSIKLNGHPRGMLGKKNPRSEEAKKNISESLKGKKKSNKHKEKLSHAKQGKNNPTFGTKSMYFLNYNKAIKIHLIPFYMEQGWKLGQIQKPHKPREQVRCPHCDKVGDISNLKRWHFNNCKLMKF